MSTLAEGLPTRTVPLTVEEMGRDTDRAASVRWASTPFSNAATRQIFTVDTGLCVTASVGTTV